MKENLNQNIYKQLSQEMSDWQKLRVTDSRSLFMIPRSSGAESYRLLAEEVINREDD